MQVVILCGGKGTRMSSLTKDMPKPLINVGEIPIVVHIMNHFSSYGYNNFILCTGYKKDAFFEYFSKESNPNWNVTILDTGEEAESASRILQVASHLEDEFFLTYGDGVSNVNLCNLLKYHRTKETLITITGVHPISSYGVIDVKDGFAIDFKEKAKMRELINGGFMVIKKEALKYFNSHVSLEEGPLTFLASKKQLAVFKHNDFWSSIDTVKDVERLNKIWSQGNAPWVIHNRRNDKYVEESQSVSYR
ncbi:MULTISPECIES: sugar phosphate nucleotidyltransferase [Bacillus cereus group]|uniref:sugar phosphate nucleotidyltransferase n=1 Tax=Bacillus cereus group TaxID=86661 RepID=UPI001F55BA45|nr:sugar phosphate nucleotidyltransferase [Bacillus pacificus]MED0823853.1 sugar phosphate nucleotidyltransferase [Bacillus pacificus]